VNLKFAAQRRLNSQLTIKWVKEAGDMRKCPLDVCWFK
jgi:hypothetical protein